MAYVFEDLVPGRQFDAGRRVVSAADIAAFAALSGDRNPLHVEGEEAERGAFGGQVAHGALGVAIGTGLISEAGLTRGVLVALLELRWKFVAPILPGDAVHARVSVLERRPTKRDDRGIVRFAIDLRNQRNELVQEGELTELIARRAATSEAPAAGG